MDPSMSNCATTPLFGINAEGLFPHDLSKGLWHMLSDFLQIATNNFVSFLLNEIEKITRKG